LPPAYGPAALSLKVGDVFEIEADELIIAPRCPVNVTIRRADGTNIELVAIAAIETMAEVENLRAGGILPRILQDLTGTSAT
jgi:aconitate hydratase